MKQLERDEILIRLDQTMHGQNGDGGVIKVINDHEDRIRSNEKWRWILKGGFLLLAALLKFGGS